MTCIVIDCKITLNGFGGSLPAFGQYNAHPRPANAGAHQLNVLLGHVNQGTVIEKAASRFLGIELFWH